MSVARRRLLMGRGRGGYVDNFTALSSRWIAQAGSLAVSGGALQAATLGNWGPSNLFADSGVENWDDADTPTNWNKASTGVVAREDSDVHTGSHCAALTQDETGTIGRPFLHQTVPFLVGATYFGSLWAKRVDAIGCRLALMDANSSWYPIVEDDPALSWTFYSGSKIASSAAHPSKGVRIYQASSVPVTVLVDDILVCRRNAPALLTGWRSPNHVTTLSHISPASGVVPFSYICRYTDSLNYWEVRVLPNTAGNDLQIIQVTDGAETTRAEADVDWTSGGTDELMVDCRGATIATYHRKSGASVWTAGPSYANAAQGMTSPNVGVMLYETGVGRLAGFEIRAL